MTVGASTTVEVHIPRPARTGRLLTFFRGFMLLPHFLFLVAIGLAAYVALLINYIAVLITGRAVFFGFLAGVLRYGTRITAYSYFLTDAYPPFSLGQCPDYPVQVVVPLPGHIHRWRVFSAILAIPHIIVLYLLVIASAVATLFAFLVILVVARYPRVLFGVTAATVRYQARVNAYLYLITHGYPPFSLS